VLTITVPATAFYIAFNLTVTGENPAPIAPTTFTVTVGAKIAVNPTAKASQSYTVNSSITVDLNVTDSPPFSGFTGAFFFNESVLRFQTVDYSGSVLGNDAQVSSECLDARTVDGSNNICLRDLSYDALEVFSLVLYTSLGSNTTTPTGKLFSVTFTVIRTGFSPIHLVQNEVQAPCNPPSCTSVNIYNTVAYDGYFTNKECSTGNLCKPPVVSFLPPLRPVTGRPVSFNGTAVSQNPGGAIREYNWTWGGGLDVHQYNSPPTKDAKLGTNATFIFLQIGNHVVTLSAEDNYGARAYYTLAIFVLRVWVDLGFSSLVITPSVGVVPGTVVHIVATAVNLGVNPENSTISLSINNQNKAMKSVQNLEARTGAESSLPYDWNTANLTPRVYRVDADLAPVRNATTGQNLENDTIILNGRIIDPNNVKVAFIQLIQPVPSGIGVFLGLNLPETIGLGIILVAVIGFVVGLVKKSRIPGPEPL